MYLINKIAFEQCKAMSKFNKIKVYLIKKTKKIGNNF